MSSRRVAVERQGAGVSRKLLSGGIMNIVYALILIGASLAASGQSELSKQTEAANPPFKLEIRLISIRSIPMSGTL